MRKEKSQYIPFQARILTLKQAYLQGKFQDLVLHDEYMYPPVEKDIREILVSQFGQALQDEYIRNYSEEKMDRKSKFPLPIVFAFIHHHLRSNRHQSLIRIILQHVDRKATSNYYLIMYIIAKIYEKFAEYKKSIFYLENLLKDEPFFQPAVYDLCYHYAFRLGRQQQACTLLQRHLNNRSSNDRYIVSLYLSICSKFKLRNVKDVARVLHNHQLNLTAYFNLGLFFRMNDELEKAEEIFSEIISKLTRAKSEGIPTYSEKDEKMLLLSHVNKFLILQMQAFDSKSRQNTAIFAKQILCEFKGKLDSQTISKLSLIGEPGQLLQSPKSQRMLRNFYSTRKLRDFTRQYKPQRTEYQEKTMQNKENVEKLASFNQQFSNIRNYNTNKLKYLLEKQKEINSFFKNIVIKHDSSSEKYQIDFKLKEKVNHNSTFLQKSKVNRLQNVQFFEKQFQDKRKMQELNYNNVELQSMLAQILTNFQNCVSQRKKESKIDIISKKYTPLSKHKLPMPKPSLKNYKHSPSKYSNVSYDRATEERRTLKTENTTRMMKSDRSAQGFRIKKANKQQKEIRQEKQEELFYEIGASNTDQQELQTLIENHQISCGLTPPCQQQNQLVIKQEEEQMELSYKKESSKNIEEEQQAIKPLCSDKKVEIPIINEQNILQPSVERSSKQVEIIAPQMEKQEEVKNEEEENSRQASLQQSDSFQQQNKESTKQLKENLKQQKKPEQVKSQSSQSNPHISEKRVETEKSIQPILKQSQKQIFQPSPIVANEEPKIQQPVIEISLKQQSEVKQTEISVVSQPKIEQTPPKLQSEVKIEEVARKSELVPLQQNVYDPMASTFQLTGFNKSSLSKFRDLKKKKTLVNSDQNEVLLRVTQDAKKNEQKISMPPTKLQEQLMEGSKLEKQGKHEAAYALYTKLYKFYKKQTEKQIILIRIGTLFEQQEKFSQAEKTYLKCTKFNNVEAFIKLGSLLLKNGRISSGVQNIEKANCIKRNDIQIQNKLVYGYSLKEETMQKALTLAQVILKKEPQSLQTLIITANILQKQGKIKEAIQIVTAVDRFKETQYIKHYLGVLYLQDSNLTEAFNYFKAALAIKPDYIPSLIEVATIISQISPKQSITVLKKVLQIQPQNRKALARLGKIHESIENDFQSAMYAYQTALETQQNYESYIKIGDCLAKKQSYIQALINYKEALNLRKTHQAYAKVANMFEMKEQYTKAIQNYELALEFLCKEKDGINSAKRKEYLMFLGNLSLKVGNYDAGIKFFEDIEDHEESIEILKLLAQAYFGKKQYNIALERFQKANKIANGDNLQILEKIAICFDKQEEYLASRALYQKILEKDPQNIRCINNLANILLIIGETNESFYLFQSMLQKAPKNLEKRLKVADIYAEVGDWSKVEFHLQQCFRLKENDQRVLERLVNLYKEKRDVKMANKYQKKLTLLRKNHKSHQKNGAL